MVLLLLNKPFGVLSQFTGSDCTLADHVREPGVYPAGRLDRDSEGLLLLTDDGKLQARISQPRYKLAKKYWIQVEGVPDSGQLDRLRNGITLKDGRAHAVSVEIIDAPGTLWDRVPPIRERRNIPTHWLDLSIDEGRNRQVRRMTAAVNLPTLRLIRHQVGPWKLDGLRPGEILRIEGQQAWDALRA
jgi:23S rRNA pseudouridine2457 synthase